MVLLLPTRQSRREVRNAKQTATKEGMRTVIDVADFSSSKDSYTEPLPHGNLKYRKRHENIFLNCER